MSSQLCHHHHIWIVIDENQSNLLLIHFYSFYELCSPSTMFLCFPTFSHANFSYIATAIQVLLKLDEQI